MKIKYTVSQNEYQGMDTQALRNTFLADLFEAGTLNLLYCETERAVIGAAVPTEKALELTAGKELAADYFCQRREIGVLNIGQAGTVTVDGTDYPMANREMLYIGRGSQDIRFSSSDPAAPARYYLLSYPAHTEYPTTHATPDDANTLHLGSPEQANERTLRQFIHPDGIQSCQLVMGYTEIKPGSVWNTMPCHTHQRRTEIYLYFDIDAADRVFHFMGPGAETRHLVMANEQCAISPMWSIHSGCGTGSYAFCWGMGGENQRFDDMDHIAVSDLK